MKGGYPLSQKETTNRNSPKCAPAREGVAVRGANRFLDSMGFRKVPGGSINPLYSNDLSCYTVPCEIK